MDYRETAHLGIAVLRTILATRLSCDSSQIDDVTFGNVMHPQLENSDTEAYLSNVYSALKSLIKCQSAVGIKLQIFEIDKLDAVTEEWHISLKILDAELDDAETQALLDQIVASASFSPEIPKDSVFRVLLTVNNELRLPSQCRDMGQTPIVRGEAVEFRSTKQIHVLKRATNL